MPGRMLLVEGMDLAGKSTLVVNLARELAGRGYGVRVSRNALCPDNPVAAVADRVRRDAGAGLLETGSLFLAAHLWDARHFTPPPDGMVHLQDSCWLRTLAYHEAQRTPAISHLLRDAARSFPRFEKALYLTAALSRRQTWLARRAAEQPESNDAGDRLVLTNPAHFAELDEGLERIAAQWTNAQTVDTTDLTAGQVLAAAVRHLEL